MLHIDKYGDCPARVPTDFKAFCADTCHGTDYRCPDIQRCCPHSCGRTCQIPDGLNTISNAILPQIPQNVSVTNLVRQKNTAEITWHMTFYIAYNRHYTFVIEARSHIGSNFGEHKLSRWFNVSFDITTVNNLQRGSKIEIE